MLRRKRPARLPRHLSDEHGKGYIEVHHSMPLAEHGVRETDPTRDPICLCANCHRMVHRRRAVCLSLSELRAKLAQAKCDRLALLNALSWKWARLNVQLSDQFNGQHLGR